MPNASNRSATFWERAASPIITGTIGWLPGRIANPLSVRPARNERVFSSKRSRSSVEREAISIALREAATIHGVKLLEKRYGRERWRRRSIIGFRPAVYPPVPPDRKSV